MGYSNIDSEQVLNIADAQLEAFQTMARADGMSEEQIAAETPALVQELVKATMEGMKTRAIANQAMRAAGMGGPPSPETLEDLRRSGFGSNWRR